MISAVRSTTFPYLPVHVRLGNQQYPDYEFDVDALVDTGFDGGLAVSRSVIPSTVPSLGQYLCELADGSSINVFAYLGFLSIGHLQPIRSIVIALLHQTLLGRSVTNHFRLSFFYGRQVILES